MPPEVEDDEPLRWYVIAAYVGLVGVGFVLAIWLTVVWYSDCEDGQKVAPFVAGDSTQGHLCDSHATLGVVPVAWLLGLALATFALVRWGGRRVWLLLCGVLLLTPALLPFAAYAAISHTGTTCTGAELDAYDAWAGKGSKGRAPYDCRTF